MTAAKFDIDNLRIASPCPVAWDTMKGDERKRFCDLCSLNVYNISEMTRREAESLIRDSEGRICARLYKRSDGTVITKDCPAGLRAVRKRLASIAGAAFSLVLGLFSVGYSQCKIKSVKNIVPASKLRLVKRTSPAGSSGFSGVITDPNGAVVPNMPLYLFGTDFDKPLEIASREDGAFSFTLLKPGKYTLVVKPSFGFKGIAFKALDIEQGTVFDLIITLELEKPVEMIGVVGIDSLIDQTRPGGTTVITREMIDRLP